MKYKTILQHDERDCGAACLATVTNTYQCKLSLSYARQICKTDASGTNLYGIVYAARSIGFDADSMNGTLNDMICAVENGTVKLPCIVHMLNENHSYHYIVVFNIHNGNLICGDPGKGTILLSLDEFADQWTGYLISLTPGKGFPAELPKTDYITEFKTLLQGTIGKLILVMLLSLLVAGIGIAGSFVFEIVIDDYFTEHDHIHEHVEESEGNHELNIEQQKEESEDSHEIHGEKQDETTADLEDTGVFGAIGKYAYLTEKAFSISSFGFVFLIVALLYLLQVIIQLVRGKLILSVSKIIDVRLSMHYFEHIQDANLEQIRYLRTGEYLSRLNDIAIVRNVISTMAISIMIDVSSVIACGFILYSFHAKLFSLSMIVLVPYLALVVLYRAPLENSNRNVMQNHAEVQAYYKETIDGIETIRAASATQEIKTAARAKYMRFANALVKNGVLSVSMESIADALEMLGNVFVLWAGFTLALRGEISLGSIVTFYILLSYFNEPVKNLINLQPEIQQARIAIDRLHDVLDIKKEETGEKHEEPIPRTINSWALDDVSFRYGNQNETLSHVSVQFSKGKRTAIIGESGSGKSTLVKLFLRFYSPESGIITADGKSVDQYAIDDLRHAVSYVSQDSYLFSGSIRNNLTMGLQDVEEEELKAICHMCCLDELLESLPMGIDTPIEENGCNLSSGQRQRIAIARALLNKPQLLILDEATSNLAVLTERNILKAIDQFAPQLTQIIITHRLAQVKQCDQIYVLDHGAVVAKGSHEELMMNSKINYKDLW